MRVDWQTLRDLGILDAGDYQLSVFEWANFTRTDGGAKRLRERFKNPLSDARLLRETQDAVCWLEKREDRFDGVRGAGAWRSIERYVSTAITELAHPNQLYRWLDSWWVRWLNADVYREVMAALALVQTLARAAAEIADGFESENPPLALESWRNDLRNCLDSPALAPLIASANVHQLRPPKVLALDAALRGEQFGTLRQFASLVYEADFLCSLAAVTRERGLVIPQIVEKGPFGIEAEGLYHPLLDQPVENSLSIGSDHHLMFVTGANMTGKSTYLKAAGVAVFLAHVGMGVPARAFRLTPFDCLFSGINTTDNLRLGQSFFYREVERVREIVQILGAGTPSFVLFDEMFKGTNLKDASDASMAVISGFSACEKSAFIIASHIAEIAPDAQRLHGVRLCHFGAELECDEPRFDYELREGVSVQHLGMLMLKRAGVLDGLASLDH